MLKPLILFALCLSLLACGHPQVNIKQRWNQTLVNYSFVPIYPARGDVDVGDVRIHIIDNPAEALDSRLISDWRDNEILEEKPDYTPAILPGLEAVRTISLDTEATGLAGVIRGILGSRITASKAVYVSLQGLETAEVADEKVARQFVRYLQGKTDGTDLDFLWGLCAAAQTYRDPKFKHLGLSIVTRVIRAREITYYSGSAITNVQGDGTPTPAGSVTDDVRTGQNEKGTSATFRTGSNLPKASFGRSGVVVGVDALMIRRDKVVDDLAGKCKGIAGYFAASRLGVLHGAGRAAKGRD